MKKANAIARAWAWFQGAMKELMGFVQQIPTLAINAFKSLELVDIILVPRAFMKVAAVFGNFIGSFISWAGNAVWNLLQIIFEVLAPGAVPYLKKVGGAFKTILKNPISFVGNLVKAGKLGFEQFAKNIGKHLKASLLEWLTGSLPGVYLPKALSFFEIVKFVLSVLGLTWANIRPKIVKIVTEPVMKVLETGFVIVVKLVTDGPAAAWEEIQKQFTDLKDMAIQAIMDFVVDTVVKKAVAKVVSLLVPGGAFIQAIITIYDTIMVFVDKLKKIIEVVTAFLDSMMAIVSGAIGGAANKVETTLAGLLTLAISFLAGFAGLGKIADKVMEIITKKIRTPIDQALNKVIDWIVTTAKKLFASLFGKKEKPESAALKAKVKAELNGKKISDYQQAAMLISSIFSKYAAQGLKGIRLVYDPKKPEKASIKVSASPVEEIADLPVDRQGLAQALHYSRQFHYMAERTILYVYYDTDNKPLGTVIRNEGVLHAEQVFKNRHLSELRKKIQDDRQAGVLKTPAGQPVKVELNLNRVPCPETCSPLLAGLSGTNPDLRFVVKASSASNQANAEITADYIEKMLASGVDVSTLKIFEAIENKIIEILMASGAKEIELTPNDFEEIKVAIPRNKENLSKEKSLQDMINQATQKLQKTKSLDKVPPAGSGI
jgi:hypothetical protein